MPLTRSLGDVFIDKGECSMRLNQKERLFILLLYIGILLFVSYGALSVWVPPVSSKGLWFYAGIAALLMGSLLETPFYTSPKDAISNSVAAILTLISVNIWTPQNGLLDRVLWVVVVVYAVVTIIFSVVAIVLKDATTNWKNIGRVATIFSSTIGTPKWMFSAVYIFALIAFHRNSPKEYLVIGIVWFVIVAFQPLETLWGVFKKAHHLLNDQETKVLGRVVGYQTPNVAILSQIDDSRLSYGDMIAIKTKDGVFRAALVLDYLGFVDSPWLRALMFEESSSLSETLHNRLGKGMENNEAVRIDDVFSCEGIMENEFWKARDALIGLVAPGTRISRLRIDVVRGSASLKEGELVETWVNGRKVLYQIVGGLTEKEILQQKNTRGFIRAEARKVGAWNETLGKFEIVEWLPVPNTPVFLVRDEKPSVNGDAIGYFPGTRYPVSVLAVDHLVTHNTAILGILGSGKSFLALELIERMIEKGIKVICLDMTNQYAQNLKHFYVESEIKGITERLQEIGPQGKENVQKNVHEGGSIQDFRSTLKEYLEHFLSPENTGNKVTIFNPSEFEVWRQVSKPYQGKASMALLTPPQITQIFAETALEILQDQGMTDKARCCLVFEEAHSLIPEWNSVVDEGDKTATNGTARAILQGRKFGLGSLVITQRTANVTKSILNQCNTVFALRVFDTTGMNFLKNYIGDDYVDILSTIEERHAVFFGKASSCDDPVLVRLNDRPDFLRSFRFRRFSLSTFEKAK